MSFHPLRLSSSARWQHWSPYLAFMPFVPIVLKKVKIQQMLPMELASLQEIEHPYRPTLITSRFTVTYFFLWKQAIKLTQGVYTLSNSTYTYFLTGTCADAWWLMGGLVKAYVFLFFRESPINFNLSRLFLHHMTPSSVTRQNSFLTDAVVRSCL